MRELLVLASLAALGVGLSCRTAEAHDCTCPPDDAREPGEAGDAAHRPPAHDRLTLTKVRWKDLPGWTGDKHGEALPSFLASCAKLAELPDDAPVGHDGHGGFAKQWRHACERAAKLDPNDHAAARAFFESEFVPYQAAGKTGPIGKLTGYFVQELHASRKRGGKYQVPILARPPDLVMIDLSQFIRDAHGRRVWGRHDATGKLVPYFTRAEIRGGALAAHKLELMYADNPIDVLFAHIEGSAKAVMDDGTTVWLEFAGKNGRNYRGVGAMLEQLGVLVPPYNGTMPGLRKWFTDHPKRFDEIVDNNHSYVFFKESAVPGAVGSQGVILTPRRSLAIDRAFIAHSTPIWVDAKAPVPGKTGTAPWRQLVIAQDTGGGILGAVRGDIYWGDDAVAEELGGRMGGEGRYWLLLPKGVTK